MIALKKMDGRKMQNGQKITPIRRPLWRRRKSNMRQLKCDISFLARFGSFGPMTNPISDDNQRSTSVIRYKTFSSRTIAE